MKNKISILSNIFSGLIISIVLFAYQFLITEICYVIWGLTENDFSGVGTPNNSLILICMFLFSLCYCTGYEFTYKMSKWRILFTILCYGLLVAVIQEIPLYINRDYDSEVLEIALLIVPLIAIAIRELIDHKEVDEQKCFPKGIFTQIGIAVTWLAAPPLFYEWSKMNKHRKILLCALSPFTIFFCSLIIGAIVFVLLLLIAIWSPE